MVEPDTGQDAVAHAYPKLPWIATVLAVAPAVLEGVAGLRAARVQPTGENDGARVREGRQVAQDERRGLPVAQEAEAVVEKQQGVETDRDRRRVVDGPAHHGYSPLAGDRCRTGRRIQADHVVASFP